MSNDHERAGYARAMAISAVENYSEQLIGEYREANWVVSGVRPTLKALCRCPARHLTYIRTSSLTREYVQAKIHWLFNETCYGSAN